MQTSKIKFWVKIVAVFLFVVFFSGLCKGLTDITLSDGFLYSYADKLDTLKNIQDKKTVFIGGSSVLFGFSAEEYEKISGEPTINMGLNAGPYDVYMSSVLPYIHEGDTVVLALEFEAYTSEWYKFDEVSLDVSQTYKDYYKSLPVQLIPKYFYKKILRNCNRSYSLLYSLIRERIETEDALYLRKSIMKNGDIDPALTLGNKDIEPLKINTKFNYDSMNKIMEYIKAYEQKGARVYIAYPPCYTDVDSKDLKAFSEGMRNFFGDYIIGEIYDWSLSTPDNFYDTPYHLNNEGCVLHSQYYYQKIREKHE